MGLGQKNRSQIVTMRGGRVQSMKWPNEWVQPGRFLITTGSNMGARGGIQQFRHLLEVCLTNRLVAVLTGRCYSTAL
jgi:hypothetical protein